MSTPDTDRPTQQLRVLLLDPDPLHLDVWTALFSYVGYEVLAARTCLDAAKFFSRRIQCVVLEHDLPDMSGVEFIRYFRAAGSPRFVMLTHESSAAIHLQALEAGASAVLTKPSALGEVVEAVEQACWELPHVAPMHCGLRMTA